MCTHLLDEPALALAFFSAAARNTSILGEFFNTAPWLTYLPQVDCMII